MSDDKFFEYYNYYEQARSLEKLKKEDDALQIYLHILNEYDPIGTAYYERPAIILERQKKYKEAVKVCKQAIKAIGKADFHANPEEFEHRLNRLNNKIAKQEDPTSVATQKKVTNKIVKNSTSTSITSAHSKEITTKIEFPDWYVSISFGESKSQSFPQALTLAKLAPQYIENPINNRILYQAVYSDKPREYLAFIKLYELVSSWKSCFVVINSSIMDRKIIGGLNYCYGDKCRSGKPDFCFGASEMTANPFGCHRLQISAANHPWWSFGSFTTNRIWKVDKKALLERIESYSIAYEMCPSFSIDKIKEVLNKLPDHIDLRHNKIFIKTHTGIQPRDLFNAGNIILDLNQIQTNPTTSAKENNGLFSKLKSLFKK